MTDSQDEPQTPSFVPRYKSEADVPGYRKNALRQHSFRVFGDSRGLGRWRWSDASREPLTKQAWPFHGVPFSDVYSVQFLNDEGRPVSAPILIDPRSEPRAGIIDPEAYKKEHHRHLSKVAMRRMLGARPKEEGAIGPAAGPLNLSRALRQQLLRHSNALLSVNLTKLPAETRDAILKARTDSADALEIVDAIVLKLERGRRRS